MKWQRYWPESLVALLVVLLDGSTWLHEPTTASSPLKGPGWTAQRKLAMREKTRELWYHGFDSYMTYAFPLDELTPLSCQGQGPDWANPKNIAINDVAGNFSLTLIDVLDTLVVLDDRQGFEKAVRNVIDWVSFDVNTKPQVFETTIRVLGGLLSGHIFASQPNQTFHLPWYQGELLELAYDLGNRLLPAFSTPTGLPYARINLRHGVAKGETVETCTAGAGSLILEFATLSRLTGDPSFEKAAKKAFFAIWNRKSDIGLVGNTINIRTGDWISPEVLSIGAGIDSFFEYAMKWYILSGEVEFLDVWDEVYASIMRYSRAGEGYWFRMVSMKNGDVLYNTVDSLSAFWPGLQVLAGDIEGAIRSHMMYYNIWKKHAGLPEVYDTQFKQATSHQYPLRPELIESTWYLYRATKDPFYLDVAERILFDISTRSRVYCGLAGIADLRSNKRDDRMESFALSETLKYLYLLFDEDNPIHSDDSNYVFTTEGHILTLSPEHVRPMSAARRKLRGVDGHQCYKPSETGLVGGILARSDVDYSRHLVALNASEKESYFAHPNGVCSRPRVELFSYEFVLSPNGQVVSEDLSPSLLKLAIVPDGYSIQNVSGIRTQIVQRLDGKGYDIRRLANYIVHPGEIVYINDTEIFPKDQDKHKEDVREREPFVPLRFYIEKDNSDPVLNVINFIDNFLGYTNEILATGFTSLFGKELALTQQEPLRLNALGVPVVQDSMNQLGCQPFTTTFQNAAVLIRRGDCTFLQKLKHASSAGAVGAIIMTDEVNGINPTASPEEIEEAGDLGVLLVLTAKDSESVKEMVQQAGGQPVMVAIDWERRAPLPVSKVVDDHNHPRILYLNGHPLLNTRLLV